MTLGISGGSADLPPALAPPPPAGPPPPPAARPSLRSLTVDPRTVRFTHDSINACFRSGTAVDDAIEDILKGKMKIRAFPPIEVSRDTIGIGVDEGESGGRRGDRGEGRCQGSEFCGGAAR